MPVEEEPPQPMASGESTVKQASRSGARRRGLREREVIPECYPVYILADKPAKTTSAV